MVAGEQAMERTARIVRQAMTLGASLAGAASVADLRTAPSYRATGWEGVWPDGARSVLVMALAHPLNRPELDWWGVKGGTAGNRKLMDVSDQLGRWLDEEMGVASQSIPYYPEKGGIFLKDAAVLAGLGVIGAHNLLITPEFGPQVRLRAIFIFDELKPAELLDFSPCQECPAPCRRACANKAFESGRYNRDICNAQLRRDEEAKVPASGLERIGAPDGLALTHYCRSCEKACRVRPRANGPDSEGPGMTDRFSEAIPFTRRTGRAPC